MAGIGPPSVVATTAPILAQSLIQGVSIGAMIPHTQRQPGGIETRPRGFMVQSKVSVSFLQGWQKAFALKIGVVVRGQLVVVEAVRLVLKTGVA